MIIEFYLIVDQSGSVKTRKTKADVAWSEIAVMIRLSVPDQLFQKPQLTATITVPQDAATAPVISSEVQDNIAQAIKEHSGFNVSLRIEKPETDA